MLPIFAAIISVLLALFAIAFFLLELYVGVIGDLKGAPFVPSKPNRVKTMIELANITQGTRVIDLGSGDGSILIKAAMAGAIATGIEINPFLIPYSRWRARRAGVQHSVTVIRGEINNFPIDQADVIFLYLLPKFLVKLKSKLAAELKPGALVISNAFPVPGWTPIQEKNGVFLYQI
ncbi:MAG: methyltransferase domain-containing protein [bacterium]|nr:methyltransferase domain-containing protein [bacterium]